MTGSTSHPLAILGGGPVGLALALLLARRGVPSVVFDARSVEQAAADRRLLALSLGSLQTLAQLTELPAEALAPIRSVVVSSAGQFGRAVIDESDVDAQILGATIHYGDLVAALSAAAEARELITVRRPLRISAVRQAPAAVAIEIDGDVPFNAALALSAEGFVAGSGATGSHAALVADLEVLGIKVGTACERFTRDGPLALLPLPARGAPASHKMALVWCMTHAQADRRSGLSDAAFIAELSAQIGARNLRILALESRGRYPLTEQARDDLVEHRIVYLGNAAQTLHPVAGQGLNLGLRDALVLADQMGGALATAEDPLQALRAYSLARRADRAAIVALTKSAPAFFSTRFAPIALARSMGLTALAVVPNLRREFARLLMFGVRF